MLSELPAAPCAGTTAMYFCTTVAGQIALETIIHLFLQLRSGIMPTAVFSGGAVSLQGCPA
jgi:hypothetical protein